MARSQVLLVEAWQDIHLFFLAPHMKVAVAQQTQVVEETQTGLHPQVVLAVQV